MMKTLILVGAVLIAAPVVAKAPVKHLEGVSDKETTIPYRDVKQSVRGHGGNGEYSTLLVIGAQPGGSSKNTCASSITK